MAGKKADRAGYHQRKLAKEKTCMLCCESSMDEFVQLAHCQALYWTELVFGSFVKRGLDLPPDWPGSVEQARLLVAIAANGEIEPSNCERLVDIVQHRARFLWQEFRSFH
jgi:hypothetical protein